MIDPYTWVPWFRDLTHSIADGGEEFLSESAAKVDWKTKGPPPLLSNGPENIDPFSFFYYLAAKSANASSREIVYPSVDAEFGTSFQGDLTDDHGFVLPVPPAVTALFRDGDSFHPSLLWRLFRAAASGVEKIDSEDFDRVLRFNGVKIRKLTQALFLVNPRVFLPCDEFSAFALCGRYDSARKWDWATYRRELDVVRHEFPELRPYEINRSAFLYLDLDLGAAEGKIWQTSTNVDNSGKDYWDEFRRYGVVYHRGPGDKQDRKLYLPKPGDLVLARMGRSDGRGIGVVSENHHTEEWKSDQRMEVLWFNAAPARLAGKTAIGAFLAGGTAFDVFRQTTEYKHTIDLLWSRSPSPNGLLVLADETQLAESELRKIVTLLKDKKQVIFQGPPGTGKTYLARKLAKCLADSEDRVQLVQFHPSYAYEDFVQGYRPTLTGGTAGFALRDGPLLESVQEGG